MFGLKALFASLSRLTAAVTRSAELFESANQQLEQRLGLDSDPPALAHVTEAAQEEPRHRRNGRKIAAN